MNSVTISYNLMIPAKELFGISFIPTSNLSESVVTFNSHVVEEGLDIEYFLIDGREYDVFEKWWRQVTPTDPRNTTIVSMMSPKPKQPLLNPYFSRRTNYLENKTVVLPTNSRYTLVLNNSYSRQTPKNVATEIKIESKKNESNVDLPIIEQFKGKLPKSIFENLVDANNCFVAGHWKPSAIMLRKALEQAIQLKTLQTSLDENILRNKLGDEYTLSKKINILFGEGVISKKVYDDINTVKWFGDSSAHTKMKIAPSDIKEIIEPKLRKFLIELNLKSE